jgi:hypothetical protein
MAAKLFWIKERYNPQLGTYYVPYGQRSKAYARKCENSLYGSALMRPFNTSEEYRARIAELIAEGLSVSPEHTI